MPGRGNPLLVGQPSIFSTANANGTPMGFSDAAGINTSNVVNTSGTPMNFANAAGGTSVFDQMDSGLDSLNTYVPTNQIYSQAEKEAIMADRYANTVINAEGGKGYTGQGAAGGRNPITPSSYTSTTPTPNTGGGSGGRTVAGTSIPQVVLNPQDLSQRTPSGSMYAPDLSAYNDSSLFNYTGPGGVNEYTYGQDLPYQGAGYDIWGSPADAPNPYFWGQFATEPVTTSTPQGPADGAIGLPPINMPAGVPNTNNNPNVGTNNTNIGSNTSSGGGPNYWSEDNQRVYEMMQQRNEAGDGAGSSSFNQMDSGLDGLNDLSQFPIPTAAEDPFYQRNVDKQKQNSTVQPFTPREHNPVVTVNGQTKFLSEVTPEERAIIDQTSWAGGEGMNESAFFDDPNRQMDSGLDFLNEMGVPAIGTEATEEAGADSLARRVAEGMGDNLATLKAKGDSLQAMNDAFEARALEKIRAEKQMGSGLDDLNDMRFPTSRRDVNYGEEGPPGYDTFADGTTIFEPTDYNTRRDIQDAKQSLFDYSADDRFRQTPQSIADVDINARPMNFADAAGTITGGTETEGGKTGFSGKNATDVTLENLVEQMETGGSGYLNSLRGLPMRLLTGGDVTEKAINQHIINKSEDYGDGLAGYKDESTDGYTAVSGNPYHIRSGRDVGNLTGDKNLLLGGIPAALGGYAYQQLSEGAKDFGIEGLLQATDNARGLALSGNAPAVKSIFDVVDNYNESKERMKMDSGLDNIGETKTNQDELNRIADKKNKAKVAAEAKAKKAAEVKAAEVKRKKGLAEAAQLKAKKAAETKAKQAAEAKKKADTQERMRKQLEVKAAEEAKKKAAEVKRKKGLAEAAALKAKKAAEAKKKKEDEAARNARENARRPTPAPKPKSKSKTTTKSTKTGPSGKTAKTVKSIWGPSSWMI